MKVDVVTDRDDLTEEFQCFLTLRRIKVRIDQPGGIICDSCDYMHEAKQEKRPQYLHIYCIVRDRESDVRIHLPFSQWAGSTEHCSGGLSKDAF